MKDILCRGNLIHSVHQGINTSSKTPPPCFLSSPPLNLQTTQAVLFLSNPPLYIVLSFFCQQYSTLQINWLVSIKVDDCFNEISITCYTSKLHKTKLRYLKNVKNTHGGVLILVKLHAEACNFPKSNTPLWVFFMFFKSCKWYQIT